MKKLLSLLAVIAIMLSCSVMGIGTVASAAEESPEADFMAFDGVLEEYIGPGGNVVIPASLGIKEIAASAFYNNTDITSIVIPEGVETMGTRTFQGCENLEKVELPYSLMEIGGNCFAECKSLTEITIPALLEVVPAWAFSGCSALKKINFSYGVKEIHNQAFCSLYGLGTVIFPETVEIIACGAFNCQQDTNSVEYIICNPDCEIGLFNKTYEGNLDHKWEPDVYQTPFQSSYDVVTYKITVPKDSEIAKFLNEKGEDMFANDDTGHTDKFRLIEKDADYFDELEENQKGYGISEPTTTTQKDDENKNEPGTGGAEDPEDGDGKTSSGNKKNDSDSTSSGTDNSMAMTLIIVGGVLVLVIIICVMVVVILAATGKLGGKKKEKPLTEEEMRAKILKEMEEKAPTEEAVEEAPAEDNKAE